ncbi:response regulator [Sphingobacterium bambusae]|uniref:Two-component system response regulator n=1 Tax=Sphingobacterium bambusae TaxID=662858 RepID=A0ABW6BDI2_9SPHI|nr:response regulator [Sphingobacterium bambusae]WPL48362.1 response regulator [Sphingobacterium bambusae]
MLISVVDDDPVFQFLCRTYFTHCSSDAKLLFFSNGQEALTYFGADSLTQEDIPSLILVDINMPLIDGWQLIDEMEKMNIFDNSHVYMVSSSTAESDRDRSLGKKLVKDYLKKPLSISNFKRIFENAFGSS